MRRLLTVATVLGLFLVSARSPAQDSPSAVADTAWHFAAGSDIQFPRSCDAAQLLVVTKKSLAALDAVSGTKLWEHTDLPSLGWGLSLPCESTTGLSYRQDKIVAFDLVSGQRRWDGTALPTFLEVRGYVTNEDRDLLLLFLRTPASAHSFAAVRWSSGERLWQRDDLFQVPPTFEDHDGVSDIAGYQTFFVANDSTLIVYVSTDGPIAVDLRTGATRWKAQALAGLPVPSVNDYAGMRVVDDSTLVIPRDKGLVGVDTRDGQVRWQNLTLLPRRATRLARIPAGLLVRAGGDYINVLDAATGTSRWSKPVTLRADGGAYVLTDSQYVFVSRDRFMTVNLASGDTTGYEKLRFRDNEETWRVFPAAAGFTVVSRRNLIGMDARGRLQYQRHYKAPGTSFLQQMGGMYGNYGSVTVAGQYAYFVTNEPDSSGRKGNSLLRVALNDGSEAGRVWLREKAPSYWPDSAREQVLMLADDQTLVAIRFPSARKP